MLGTRIQSCLKPKAVAHEIQDLDINFGSNPHELRTYLDYKPY